MSFEPDTRCKCAVRVSPNFGTRDAALPIDMLIMHYTGMHTAQAAVDWLCSKESEVSCHYLIDEDGSILQMVPETKRAWHAGKSSWQGISDINSRSLGIEIVNRGHHFDYPEFPDAQIEAVIALARDVIERHNMANHQVLAHSDIAPGRKPDPGEKFPWARLYEAGVGLWVAEATSPDMQVLQLGDNGEAVASFQTLLSNYGYGVAISGEFCRQTMDCVIAFQRHFRQSRVDGMVDSGTLATLEALIKAKISQ